MNSKNSEESFEQESKTPKRETESGLEEQVRRNVRRKKIKMK
jgi:hypothetical protein